MCEVVLAVLVVLATPFTIAITWRGYRLTGAQAAGQQEKPVAGDTDDGLLWLPEMQALRIPSAQR